jgi:hypothetical protein
MLDTCRFRGEHQIRPFRGPSVFQHEEKGKATGFRSEQRKAKSIHGRVPEEDQTPPPRAAPGSHHLPWDNCSISAIQARRPDHATHGARGGWDGEFASARDAAGGFRHGGTTNATARTRNAGGRCVAGKRPNGSENGGPILWDASGTPKRSASDGRGPCCARCPRPGLTHRTDANSRLPTLPQTASRGHAAKGYPRFFAIAGGCYEPPRDSPRVTASYCSDGCRAAMDQARDRERKWLRRKREAGRFKRRLEYQALRGRRRQKGAALGGPTASRSSAPPDPLRCAVPDYGVAGGSGPSWEGSEEVKGHDSQTSSASCCAAWPPLPLQPIERRSS